jgi:hypothetical protein
LLIMGNQMAKGPTNKSRHHEEFSPWDEVLLDEFFSIIARITMRLTSKDTKNNNDITPSSQEVREL